MTPTREQVIEWAKASGLVYNNRIGEFSTPLTDGAHLDELERLCSLAYSAGRAQGLREAREVCEAEAEGFGGVAAGPFATDFGKHTHNAMAAGAKTCVAAIKQLEGK